MVQIRKTKHHGICVNCQKQQDADTDIWELRASTTGQGWTTIMFCEKCMAGLVRDIPKALNEQ